MHDSIVTTAEKFKKTLEHLSREFANLQIGRATSGLVENIDVEAYGSKQPLKNLANIVIPEPRSIAITPWDKGVLAPIEKAIANSHLGISPINDGICIRINIPALTEERRKEVVKHVHKLAEDARISIRQARHDAHEKIKKDEALSEDEQKKADKDLQEKVDEYNKLIEDHAKKKEQEVMTV